MAPGLLYVPAVAVHAIQIEQPIRRASQAPGPRFLNPLGFFLEARRDPFGYPAALAAEFGHVVRIPGPFSGFILSHPDDVKHVLQDNNRNYVKGKLVAKAKMLLGEGLFTSEGDFWRRQRRLAQPAFHRERIDGFVRTMTDTTARMLDRWDTQLDTPINLMTAMSGLTLGIVGRTLFGIDLSGESNTVGRAMA